MRSLSIAVLLALHPALPAQTGGDAPSLKGIWLGTLKLGKTELRVAFHVDGKEGAWTAKFDSLDQGTSGLKVDEATFKDGVVHFEIKLLKASFEGNLDEKANQIAGTFIQHGLKLPLELKRVDKVPLPDRPQEPKRPFPYREEEITYENPKAKVNFAGTLTMPQGDGPFPAVIFITGSGPQNRDEEIFGHKPFLLIADYLTRKGIATLRVDDRGVGGSTGSTPNSTTADFAEDVLAGMAFLKGRKEIDAKRIGLIGHSEGGVIAPLVASQSKDVAFIVMLAGTGLRGDDIVRRQSKLMAEALGASKAKVDLQQKWLAAALEIAEKTDDSKAGEKQIRELLAQWKEKAEGDDKKAIEEVEAAIGQTLKSFSTPWFRYFLAYDPVPALRKVQCPVLAINGEKDLQVPCTVDLDAIATALKEGGNKDFTIKAFPNLNHLFQTCKTGAVTEYATVTETMSPVVLEMMGSWILEHTKAPTPER